MGIAALPGPSLTRAPPDADWPDAHAAGRHRPAPLARPDGGGRGAVRQGNPSGAGTSKLLDRVINGKTADQLLREGRPVQFGINALRDGWGPPPEWWTR
ncbi:hypothetical protein [Streptomyces sp. bgisy060]|uniref:hypothetical protein n=1 Tax=Streptomyces sp. bgisy060 TaxID=3413775 RepID=UPI003EBC27BC